MARFDPFEFYEDKVFFANLLCWGNIKNLEKRYGQCFDFRDPAVKRREFNNIRNEVFKNLIKINGKKCQLNLSPKCDDKNLVVDHFIPLSSNELNKKIRKIMHKKSKKIPSQSFGSNHPSNLILACSKCNSFKKHRFIKGNSDEKRNVKKFILGTEQ